MILEKRLDDDSVIFKMPDGKKARYVNDKVFDDIRAEILNWEDEPECDDDPYQIGAKDMQKYVLRVIDKHTK